MTTTPAASAPLWRLLQSASRVVQAVREGSSATPALADVESSIRAGTQALVFAALRQLGRAQALRRHLAHRTPSAPVDALLCTALALAWNEAQAPYQAFTLVDQAVEAAKRNRQTQAQASFINACLRRFLRERDRLVAATDTDLLAQWNHPRWWIERLQADYPGQWQEILRADNAPAPMTLRVNTRKSTATDLLSGWAAQGIEASRIGECGLALSRPRPVQDIPGFAEGEVSVQDAGAQLAAPLLLRELTASGPLRILDACAAPGGKTAHLLELAGAEAEVTALDVDAQRCERVRQTLARLGLAARVLTADAAEPTRWWDGLPFDGILLDAPCTASGIVRRHPDIPWLRRESDITNLATVQRRLLASLWPLLKPAGRLLYCTCSVFKAEGQDQIRSFVAHNTDALLRPALGHLLPGPGVATVGVPDNVPSDHDGFFYALLAKRPTPDGA